MKKTFFKNSVRLAASVVAIVGITQVSCNKILEKKPENYLNATQVYRNIYDADAAVIGVYGKLMGLAKQYVILNELRADLMEVTDNADVNLRELTMHNVSPDNPYASPRPFYAVINDCNDVLKNLKIMVAANKIKQAEFDQRYSDIGCLRSWLYLQVGIHWGNVPYVTDPLETIDAVKDVSKFPVLPFNTLLDSLISFTNTLPYVQPYQMGATVNTGLMTTFDGSSTKRFFIDKLAFLGDLNLWKGNYNVAASYYRKLMEPSQNGYDTDNPGGLYSSGDQFYQEFKMPYASVTDNKDLCIGYIRYKENDINSFIDNNTQGWRSMFARAQDNLWMQQWVWQLPFNSNFTPENPFINLFSNTAGASYLVKPSKQAMDNWNSQQQSNTFPFDARGGLTWRTLNGQPVIMKYLYGYLDATTFLPISVFQKNGGWMLNRSANVHLHFAEAANRDGKRRLAYAFLNYGIKTTFDAVPAVTDVTNYQNTLYESYPYNFDARQGDLPSYRGPWYRGAGVRGVARLMPVQVTGDSTLSIENSILNEEGLELAYEGYRWADLVRIALRQNDNSIVANAVFNKLNKDGIGNAASVRTFLMDRKNWYLPFKW